MVLLKSATDWLGVIFGLTAAGLWFASTIATVRYDPKPDAHGVVGGGIVKVDETGRKIDVLGTAELQTWWNKWAAVATGLAALFQAISSHIPSAPS